MTDRPVDMSPEAVARRLEALRQLYRLGQSLKAARHLGPVRRSGADVSPAPRRGQWRFARTEIAAWV